MVNFVLEYLRDLVIIEIAQQYTVEKSNSEFYKITTTYDLPATNFLLTN